MSPGPTAEQALEVEPEDDAGSWNALQGGSSEGWRSGARPKPPARPPMTSPSEADELEELAPEPEPSASAEGEAVATKNIEPLKRSKFLSPRDVAVFNDVCQLQDGKEAAGCTCCPLSDWCVETDRPPLATIEHVFHGAFSAPGTKEVFATGYAYECGNLSGWGATWFLRHDGTKWQPVRGESSTHHLLHGATWKRDDGTRGLVAHDVIGKGFYETIAFLTFDDEGVPSRQPLISWANSDCSRRPPGYYGSAVAYVGANAVDHNRDGKRDLVIALDVRRRFVDEAFERECGIWFDDTDKPSPIGKMAAQRVTIPLLFDGASFTPDAKALAAFEALTATVDRAGKAFEY